jgi:medium-chain acyl-[acyl-carrier-protein] hydrolase
MNHDHPSVSSQEFTVASWDVDARNRLTPAAVGRLLQEAAETNARAIGFGYQELLRQGLAWVLSALLVRSDRSPRFRDRVRVETWPTTLAGRRALRDWRLLDAEGREFAAATSAWYCLDVQRRRPVSPEKWRDLGTWLPERRALDRECSRLAVLDAAEHEVAIPLRWSDLDLNDHLTNTRYQDLVLESYEADWLRTREVAEIELNFLAEGKLPDVVLSRRQAEEGAEMTWRHSLVRQSDGKEIARARVVWR